MQYCHLGAWSIISVIVFPFQAFHVRMFQWLIFSQRCSRYTKSDYPGDFRVCYPVYSAVSPLLCWKGCEGFLSLVIALPACLRSTLSQLRTTPDNLLSQFHLQKLPRGSVWILGFLLWCFAVCLKLTDSCRGVKMNFFPTTQPWKPWLRTKMRNVRLGNVRM